MQCLWSWFFSNMATCYYWLPLLQENADFMCSGEAGRTRLVNHIQYQNSYYQFITFVSVLLICSHTAAICSEHSSCGPLYLNRSSKIQHCLKKRPIRAFLNLTLLLWKYKTAPTTPGFSWVSVSRVFCTTVTITHILKDSSIWGVSCRIFVSSWNKSLMS